MKFVFAWFLLFSQICVRGLIIMTFWSWFILSQFNTLPRLSLVASIGLSMFVAVIFPTKIASSAQITDQKYLDQIWDRMIYSSMAGLMGAPFTLFFGWIVHYLM